MSRATAIVSSANRLGPAPLCLRGQGQERHPIPDTADPTLQA